MLSCLEATRITLICATPGLLRAEATSRTALAGALGVSIPDSWPADEVAGLATLYADQLDSHPDHEGWLSWYATDKVLQCLVGSIGFKGPPCAGRVELGYSVLPLFQRLGYATEMTTLLTCWALANVNADTVVARVVATNTASLRVLSKAGFAQIGGLNEYHELTHEKRKTGERAQVECRNP